MCPSNVFSIPWRQFCCVLGIWLCCEYLQPIILTLYVCYQIDVDIFSICMCSYVAVS